MILIQGILSAFSCMRKIIEEMMNVKVVLKSKIYKLFLSKHMKSVDFFKIKFSYLVCSFSFFYSSRMHILLALLCISVAAPPVCISLPTKGESVRNTIHDIISIVKITLVHIKKLRTKVFTLLHINMPYWCLTLQSICLSLWCKDSAECVLSLPSLLLLSALLHLQ